MRVKLLSLVNLRLYLMKVCLSILCFFKRVVCLFILLLSFWFRAICSKTILRRSKRFYSRDRSLVLIWRVKMWKRLICMRLIWSKKSVVVKLRVDNKVNMSLTTKAADNSAFNAFSSEFIIFFFSSRGECFLSCSWVLSVSIGVMVLECLFYFIIWNFVFMI